MEMPTPCNECGEWFDLNDGGPSADGKTQICSDCSEKEGLYKEISDGVDELYALISDSEREQQDWRDELESLLKKLKDLE
jgi:hypothetical protein